MINCRFLLLHYGARQADFLLSLHALTIMPQVIPSSRIESLIKHKHLIMDISRFGSDAWVMGVLGQVLPMC
jgi:hypothetical protein